MAALPNFRRVAMAANPEKQAKQWLAITPVQLLTFRMTGITPLLSSFPRGWETTTLPNPMFVFPLITLVFRILTITNDQINGVFPFKELPVELQNKIIKYAMLAQDGELNFPCLTNRFYKPNIAVGLLRVKYVEMLFERLETPLTWTCSHRIYHEAHYQLRKQNTFVFGNFGSDLRTIASSVGPFNCRSGACGYGHLRSVLAKVIFDLGDQDLPGAAEDKVHAFGCALRYLRCQLTINSLFLRLSYYNFRSNAQLTDFAAGLSNIKVQEGLIIAGDEKLLDMNLGEFPTQLGMNMMPMYSLFQPYNPEIPFSAGAFLYQYVPEKHVDKTTDLQHQYIAVDQTALSQARAAIDADLTIYL